MNWRQLALSLLFLGGLVARLLYLHDPFIRIEEFGAAQFSIYARNYVRFGFSNLFPLYGYVGTLPLYYINHGVGGPLLLGLWDKLFGATEAASRVLACLLSIATTGVIYLLGRDLWNRRVGLLACLIYWIMPLSIYMGRLYQIEMPQYLLILLGIWFCRKWDELGCPRYWWAAGCCLGLSTQFDIYGVFMSPALIYLAWTRAPERRQGYVVLALLAPLCLSAYFLIVKLCGQLHYLLRAAGKYARPWQLWNLQVAGELTTRLFRMTAFLPPLLAIAGVPRARPQTAWVVMLLAQPLCMLVFSLAMIQPHQFYMLYFLPMCALFTGLWLDHQSDYIAVLVVGLLVALGLPVLQDLYAPRNGLDIAVAQDVRAHTTDRDLLVGIPSHMAFYIDRPAMVPFFWHWAAPGTYPTQDLFFRELQPWADFVEYQRVIVFTTFLSRERFPMDYSRLFETRTDLRRFTEPGRDPQVWTRIDAASTNTRGRPIER